MNSWQSDSKNGKKPFSPPAISLPKGGGAIKGIGEKFAANPVTGTGSMSVPIGTSPGRSGFGPHLSLSYNSGGGNGPFGLGWSLDLPHIMRKTEKGLPRYRDKDESDVFILSGSEDLVPVLDHIGEKWEKQSVPNRTINGKTYYIQRYRPRIEGLFARIERWTNQADSSDSFWRSISSDNITTWYGKTPLSRIADPKDPSRIFSWLICQSYDDKGNAIIYEYEAEDSSGIRSSQAEEKNRTVNTRSVNRYLKCLKYGNRTPNRDTDTWKATDPVNLPKRDWMFEVVFDYNDGHYTEETPDKNGRIFAQALIDSPPGIHWPVRQDPFSSYRSCFEIRTYRLCRRVLMFHHFPNELGIDDYLVRSTEFMYLEKPVASYMTGVVQSGYKREPTREIPNRYLKKSFPPLEFEYSQVPNSDELAHRPIREIDAESLENLPIGLDEPLYRWMDLDGVGTYGILTEQAGVWYYKRNLSANNQVKDNGHTSTVARFGPAELVASKPSGGLRNNAQFLDLAGDGQVDLVRTDGPEHGFYERTKDGEWKSFQPFDSWPGINVNNPDLRFADLNGDGHLDILITENDAFLWYPSLGEKGYGAAIRIDLPSDEEKGPRLVFSDHSTGLYLADMSGDQLSDLVRIRNGEVCYWPNTGYGHFGSKITMNHSPWFDTSDRFDPRRIRLADIDGSGTTDIFYLKPEGITIYFNQSGNSWSDNTELPQFPLIDDISKIQTVDLLGNGTACLVWSSSLSVTGTGTMLYMPLMDNKPHLMIGEKNNLGAETKVFYAPSTKFYLQDKQDGKPWITRLPFPVHVVERVETYDHISRNRFVTRYNYHHGYYDGIEREFRGFGMVEQMDTEAFEDYVAGIKNVNGRQDTTPELFQPPVTTRTWFHTGAYIDDNLNLHQYRHEYYRQEQHLPEPGLPAGLDTEQLLECMRALKGFPLRQEVYSFDGSANEQNPYTISENNVEIRWLQPRDGQRHGVFFTLGKESISFNYERNPSDPRISHSFSLESDKYGNSRKSCSVVYGRKTSDPSLPVAVTRDQQKLYITYNEIDYTDDIDQVSPTEAYRLRVPYEHRGYEITGISPNGDLFGFEEIKAKIQGTTPIDYDVVADGVTPQKRLLSHSRTLFLDNALNPLPFKQWDSLGLIYQSYKLAFTPGIVSAYYSDKVTNKELVTAGYVHFDNDTNWWIPSGTAIYTDSPQTHFYIPAGSKDALGLETIATFDQDHLLIKKVKTKQATWNVVTAKNDYRVLGPVLMTDPNKNRSAVEYDILGMVVKTAVMGKAGSSDGDTLADPTTRIEYELFNWMKNGQPNVAHTFAREKHGSANSNWQESYTYSNGHGDVSLVKIQANPGKAFKVNPDGSKTEVDANPRWIGNGRVILNNKGKPVKQYEPYFSTTFEYEDEKALREIGVTPIHYYDPVGRNIRTLFPNGTLTRVEFDPWQQKTYDANDTVKESQWYADRGSPDPDTVPEPKNDPERRAAWLAAKHADTPGIVHYDSLGRSVFVVSDYGGGKTSSVRTESDLTGRFSKIFDQKQREVARGFVGMAGIPIMGYSAEKGQRWTFQNVLGAIVKDWDEHGREYRVKYDHLHRPVSSFGHGTGQSEILFNYVVYGDRLHNAVQLNLLGKTHQVFDQSGMVKVPGFDFKGNPVSVERILTKDYKKSINWQTLAKQHDYASIQTAAKAFLDKNEVFSASTLFDALNRPTRVTLPDGTVFVPKYNEANFLASLKAKIRGDGEYIEFLKGQDYDAKGQRLFARYGNDVFTRYFYDPETFRLNNLLTYKSGTDPQTKSLQNLNYTYDPVGNTTQISDKAQQTHYFRNTVVKPENLYEYDALYQLVRAMGRELAGPVNNTIRTNTDLDYIPQLPQANDSGAVRTYTEEYEYDMLGNIKTMKHRFKSQPGTGSGWTRHYQYAFDNDPGNRTNRLTATSMPGDPDAGPYSGKYAYDAYGNMTSMPHLDTLDWNFMDQLRQVDLGGGGTAYYIYGHGGQRVRKVIERGNNLNLEWIYLGAVTIYRRRRRDTGKKRMERGTVHISDNTGNIARVDTKTLDMDNTDPANPLNVALIRYQYSNHLGSAVLETNEIGDPISYEEYHPYGTTSYRSSKSGYDISLKRYRFSGKERDDETGLYYFGARYYAGWLGRWTSSDPSGIKSDLNLFRYCTNNPVGIKDPAGLQGIQASEKFDYKLTEPFFNGSEHMTVRYFKRILSKHGYHIDPRINSSNAHFSFIKGKLKGNLETGFYSGGTWDLKATFSHNQKSHHTHRVHHHAPPASHSNPGPSPASHPTLPHPNGGQSDTHPHRHQHTMSSPPSTDHKSDSREGNSASSGLEWTEKILKGAGSLAEYYGKKSKNNGLEALGTSLDLLGSIISPIGAGQEEESSYGDKVAKAIIGGIGMMGDTLKWATSLGRIGTKEATEKLESIGKIGGKIGEGADYMLGTFNLINDYEKGDLAKGFGDAASTLTTFIGNHFLTDAAGLAVEDAGGIASLTFSVSYWSTSYAIKYTHKHWGWDVGDIYGWTQRAKWVPEWYKKGYKAGMDAATNWYYNTFLK